MALLDDHQVEDIDSPRSAVGHDRLAGALAGFCGRWQAGVSTLAEDGAEVAARLRDTVASARRRQAPWRQLSAAPSIR